MNWDSYSWGNKSRSFCTAVDSSWHGGLKASDVTVSDIIFFNVMLFVWCVSCWSAVSMTAGSRCPIYSPLWNLRCLLVKLETSMLTDVLLLILWMPLIMLMFGSLPLGVLSSVRKYAIWVLIMGPLILTDMTPLCQGGILSVDLTVPIIAVWSQVCV